MYFHNWWMRTEIYSRLLCYVSFELWVLNIESIFEHNDWIIDGKSIWFNYERFSSAFHDIFWFSFSILFLLLFSSLFLFFLILKFPSIEYICLLDICLAEWSIGTCCYRWVNLSFNIPLYLNGFLCPLFFVRNSMKIFNFFNYRRMRFNRIFDISVH